MVGLALLVAGAFCVAAGALLLTGRRPGGPREDVDVSWPRQWSGERDRVRFSTDALFTSSPEQSAKQTLSPGQRDGMIALAAAMVTALVVAPHGVFLVLVGVCTLGYVLSLGVRLWLLAASFGGAEMARVSDESALSAPDEVLHSYTVLVPVFHEPEVMAALVNNLRQLDYPAERLQVLLLVEADDDRTISAAREAIGPTNDLRILVVPPVGPRTKPKALNYGLTHATGTFLTIYDAEDRPDPLQLRKAAVAFWGAPSSVACFQARLGFFNAAQNLITRWFQVEYSMWFRQMLPGLSRLSAPIPLGGTSNHFRRDVLLAVGAWDPNNVTEDADLGARLSLAGYRSEVLDSVTLEEANSDFVNWAKQRSRWYKGYLQTCLVHLRSGRPHHLTVRSRALFGFFVGGTPLMALINPVFWALTVVWFTVKPERLMSLYPAPIYYLGLLSWLAGNFLFTFASMMEALEVDDSLFLAALLTPVYWVMMSVAAYKALVQVVFAPSYWEKTRHGLTAQVMPGLATTPTLSGTSMNGPQGSTP